MDSRFFRLTTSLGRLQKLIRKIKTEGMGRVALKGSDTEAIKADTEELTKRFYSIAEKLYKDAAPQGDPSQQAEGGAQQGPDGSTVYDADYKVVDDDDKKDENK